LAQILLLTGTAQEAEHYMVRRLIKRAGLDPTLFDVQSVQACQRASISIFQLIKECNYTVVIACGDWALSQFFAKTAELGKPDALKWMGRVFHPEGRNFIVLPCLLPSALLNRKAAHSDDAADLFGADIDKKKGLHNPPRYQWVACRVLRRAVELLTKEPAVQAMCLLEDPATGTFRAYVDEFFAQLGPNTVLAWDIETPYARGKERDEDVLKEGQTNVTNSTILRISFCYDGITAVSVPWAGEYLDDIKRLLAAPCPHAGWNNANFDVPLVRLNGCTVGGPIWDFMDGWHLLQPDLDRNLEFVSAYYTNLLPWKHLADVEEYKARYSAIDSFATYHCAVGIVRNLREVGLWNRFLEEMELKELLFEAGQRGNLIDVEAQNALEVELVALLRAKLLEVQHCIPLQFHRHKIYKRLPKNAKGKWREIVTTKAVKSCSQCGKASVNKRHKCPLGMVWTFVETSRTVPGYYQETPEDDCTLDELKKWLKDNGFNPNSAKQLIRYMRMNDHPVGQNFKTGNDEANALQLLKLKKKFGADHPIYGLTLEIHKIQKALSTYVIGLKPDANGLIHTEYVNSPSTWRLGSRNVNMQNQGKRETNPYAKKARKTIIARPGHVFVQADSASIEAVFTGYFMGDANYIEIARKSIHGYAVCKKLGIDFTDENVDMVKEKHTKLYNGFKRVNHMTNYGGTPYMMHMGDPDLFPTLKAAREFQDFLFEVLPELPRWHEEIRTQARKEGYLVNPWGLRHPFYDVFTYKVDENKQLIYEQGKPIITPGHDYKRVVAFKPQSAAGFFMRDNLLRLGKTAARAWMCANVSVHDGYCLEVPEDRVEEAIELLVTILTRPISEMGGLRVGCDVEVGTNWGEMKKVRTVAVN